MGLRLVAANLAGLVRCPLPHARVVVLGRLRARPNWVGPTLGLEGLCVLGWRLRCGWMLRKGLPHGGARYL